MRTIKFRAWDKLNQVMGDVLQYLPYTGENGTIKIDINAGVAYMSHDFELMQFTGLLDKNGKEIYAGDLVNFKINMKGDILSYENAEVEVDSVWGATVSPHEAYSLGKCLDIEIIGNIYSNPDLLSKPQQ